MHSKIIHPFAVLVTAVFLSKLCISADLVAGKGKPDANYVSPDLQSVQKSVVRMKSSADQGTLDETAAIDFSAGVHGASVIHKGFGAVTSAAHSGVSSAASVQVQVKGSCTGLCIDQVGNALGARISWNDFTSAVPGVTAYVYRTDLNSNSPERLVHTVKGAATVEDGPLVEHGNYIYRVQVVDLKGNVLFNGSQLFMLPRSQANPVGQLTTPSVQKSYCTMSLSLASSQSGKLVQIQGSFQENSLTGQFDNLALTSGGAGLRSGGHYNGNIGLFSFPDAYLSLEFNPRTNTFYHAEQLGATQDIQSSQVSCGPALQPLSCAQYVTAQYQDILGRGPDANGGSLINSCNSGGQAARDQIVADLFASPAYSQQIDTPLKCGAVVAGIVHELLYREPQATEFSAYDSQCRQGQVASIVNTIVKSAEYLQKHPGTTAPSAVTDQLSSLPLAQQQEWLQFCQRTTCAGGPAAYYTYSYNLWKRNSYDMLTNALNNLGSAELSNPVQVQIALFIASLNIDEQKHTIQFYNSNILGQPNLRGIAYQDGSVLHLWNYEFALSNGKITAVLNDGKGNGYRLPGSIDLPSTVVQRVPGLAPPADEGFIQIKVVNQYGAPVNGVFIGVFNDNGGNGWQELEDHNWGTYTDTNGSTVTGVQFSAGTQTGNVTLAVCTLQTSNCTNPVVANVSAGGIQTTTITINQH